MPSFSLTNKAIADVVEIGRYTEEHWGQVQRDKRRKSSLDSSVSGKTENGNILPFPFHRQKVKITRFYLV